MSSKVRDMHFKREIAYIKGVFEQVGKRLTRVENKIMHLREKLRRELRSEITQLREEIRELNRRVDSTFRWTIALILGMWTSIMYTLIPILLKLLDVV